jgi:hypothetical protein
MSRFAAIMVFVVALSALGLFAAASDRAEATNSSMGCGAGGTCYGTTSSTIDTDGTIEAWGISYNTGTTSTSDFAWIHGTNIYHYPTVMNNNTCHYPSGGNQCQTTHQGVCSTLGWPQGCGQGGGMCNPMTNCYYATTWSHWEVSPNNWNIFTATDAARAFSACWSPMNCF